MNHSMLKQSSERQNRNEAEQFQSDLFSNIMEESSLRIVLLGKTGAGKSSLCNTMFEEKDAFKINHTANSETVECQSKTKSVNGRRITLIDTPGLFDSDRCEEELKDEIVRCITECSPGPHAFLILLKVEKFTEQENQVIAKIKEWFSEEALKYAVVLFTHGDQLPEGMKVEEFVKDNKYLCDLLEKCGGRYHVFDNKYWNNNQQDEYRNNKYQVAELLKTIQKITEQNKGGCYTNEMLQAVEREIQEEEQLIRQSSPNMSEKERRVKAKNKVYNLLKKIAGVTSEALLGALLGVHMMIISIVKALIATTVIVAKAAPAPAPVAEAAGIGGAVAAGVAAIAGAVVGGHKGLNEADETESVKDAAKNAAKAVCNQAIDPLKK